MGKCIAENCERDSTAKGLCMKHYVRQRHGHDINQVTFHDKRKHIDEDSLTKIPIGVEACNGYAIVDTEYSWIDKYNWNLNNTDYPVSYAVGLTNLLMHRFIVENSLGRKLSTDEIIHHVNGNKLDNRLDNISIITRKEHINIHRGDWICSTN